NKQTGSNITLIDINSITPSNSLGLTLIICGLMYHIVIKGLQTFIEITREKKLDLTNEAKREADIKLYERFIDILPPTSLSISLLKDHDFGHSFHGNSLKDIEKLSDKWGHADQHFHDPEIESKAIKLNSDIQKFNTFLSLRSHYIHSGPILTMLTEQDRANGFEWFPQTEKNVQEANERSNAIYKDYCDFILTCKKNLMI
ncbi:TPA: hypothetical protein ACHLB0_003597, partial [Escherichia coli]